MPVNVSVDGKIGKAAPTAKSGSGSGPETGPCEDDRGSSGSMHDLMPSPHMGDAGHAPAMDAAKEAQARRDAETSGK